MNFNGSFVIHYKNIRHAIRVLKRIKALKFYYYKVGKISFQKEMVVGSLVEKKYPYCPLRSDWYEVEFGDRFSINRLSYRTAYVYASRNEKS